MRRRAILAVGAGHLLSGVLGIGLALLLISLLTARMRPFLLGSARADIQNSLTLAVTRAVGEGNDDLANLTRVVTEALELAGRQDVAVPIGNLSDSPLFYGRGPCLRVRVLSVGAVAVHAGQLSVELTLFLPWTQEQSTIQIQIPPSVEQNTTGGRP